MVLKGSEIINDVIQCLYSNFLTFLLKNCEEIFTGEELEWVLIRCE